MKRLSVVLSISSIAFLFAVIVAAAVLVISSSNIPGHEEVELPNGSNAPNTVNTTGLPLTLPFGFSISIFARDLENPRVMVTDPAGNIISSITSEGKVVALPDKDRDGIADAAVAVLENLSRPHGLAFKCEPPAGGCLLFVAETNRVMVYDYDAENLRASNGRKLADLPSGGGHFTRTILFLPGSGSELLVSVGSSCNVCNESDLRRAKILKLNVLTGQLEEYARGLRNAVFLTASAKGEVWATEMGRDLLGDNIPPDEVNIIEAGKNYGWPNCYGKNVHDVNFDKNTYIRNPCMEPFETASFIDLQAHSAPLGLAFVPENGWPAGFGGDLLVAYHGSWNRTVPTGYKIVRLKLDGNRNYTGTEDFIAGWLSDGQKTLGRPAGLLFQGADLYISDDQLGVVYRVNYKR
ncbi:MAG: PQQ-dependent sugar dehydrogenase [Candidatus Colwellbacteria bacterium]